jgi:hypothetical protein
MPFLLSTSIVPFHKASHGRSIPRRPWFVI